MTTEPRVRFRSPRLASFAFLYWCVWSPLAAPAREPSVAVVVSPNATDLEQYAATELCGYLNALFDITSQPTSDIPSDADYVLLIGSTESNPQTAAALGATGQPRVSDQGLFLKLTQLAGKPSLVIAGGSPRATLWATYELVERWGVRYLLHGDVFPEDAGAFHLPSEDVVMEPKFAVRQWRVINDFACGPEAWGIVHYRPVLDQLAKLKFNRVYAIIYPWQPFLDLKYGGTERREYWLWYNLHYPITPDMPGRKLFDNQSEWWNPDLPLGGSYADAAVAGEKHVQSIMRHAKSRGMEVAISVNLAEFPKEFISKLKDAKSIYDGLGNLSVTPGPGQPIDDEELWNLSQSVLETTLNTYPDVDIVVPGLPEIPHWIDGYTEAWNALDAKYNLQSRFPIEKMISAAGNRHGYAGGLERAVTEVKSNVIALYLIDRLVTERRVFEKTKRPDARLMFNSMAEEVLPVLPHVLPIGSETLNLLDYTPDRIVARPGGFKLAKDSPMRHSLIFTLHDDNVGLLPMLNTGSLATLCDHMRENGWAGFSSRYWLIGDHDPCVAFIAKRSWDDNATPDQVYRDQILRTCGEDAVPDFMKMFAELESLTIQLNQHGMGLTFPVSRGMIEQHLKTEPLPAVYVAVHEGYQRALKSAQLANEKSTAGGKGYSQYWVGRLKLGVGYFDCAVAARKLATAKRDLEEAQKSGAAEQISARRAAAASCAKDALTTAEAALNAFADGARDQSDRGALAVMDEYIYRPLRDQAQKFQE